MQRRLGHQPKFEDYRLKFELLEALRQSQRDLESLRLVPRNDPYVEGLKQHLRKKIKELEDQTSEDCEPLLVA